MFASQDAMPPRALRLQSARGVDTYGRGAKLLSDAERLLQDALQVRAAGQPAAA